MRANYWTCSNFADWLRGTPKPGAETSKGWSRWKKEAKTAHPFRYWLAEEFLHHVQNFINWPGDKLNDLRYYINNRYISHSHALTAHPRDISPGSWSDVGHRFLPCMFNELVDFVEVEQAWNHCVWNDEARKKYNVPLTRTWLRFRTWRCPEAGMDHLMWASNLMLDDRSGPTQQAANAKEIIDLYVWWTAIRPARPDPYETSGWSAICNRRRNNSDEDDFLGGMEDETPEEKKESSDALDRCHAMEQQYEQEDEDMMIRLIKVRHGLWT